MRLDDLTPGQLSAVLALAQSVASEAPSSSSSSSSTSSSFYNSFNARLAPPTIPGPAPVRSGVQGRVASGGGAGALGGGVYLSHGGGALPPPPSHPPPPNPLTLQVSNYTPPGGVYRGSHSPMRAPQAKSPIPKPRRSKAGGALPASLRAVGGGAGGGGGATTTFAPSAAPAGGAASYATLGRLKSLAAASRVQPKTGGEYAKALEEWASSLEAQEALNVTQ
jgi:hypothetical protein